MTIRGDRPAARERGVRVSALIALVLLLGGCTVQMSELDDSLGGSLFAEPAAAADSGELELASDATYEAEGPAATRIALFTSSNPSSTGHAEEFIGAMADMLTAMGYEVVPLPQSVASNKPVYLVDTQLAIIAAGTDGSQKVGIDWLVSDALGDPVGKVSQARTLRANATQEQWRIETVLAAAAAAEGIARLVPLEP